MDKEFLFYGVDGNCFKLDDDIWEAIEDESDGYRSLLKTIKKKKKETGNLIFSGSPLATVKIMKVEDDKTYFTGYHIIQNDGEDEGHIWLKIGTSRTISYYPCFIFQYAIPGSMHEFDSLVSN